MAGRLKLALRAAAVSVVVLLLVLLGLQLFRTEEGRALGDRLAAGDRPHAPSFSLPLLEGDRELSLASLRGKAVVLNFWASWCGPCKDEAPVLESAWQRWRSEGLVVLGVDAQDFRLDANRFVDRYDITYPVVHDGHGSTLGRFGVTGFPETWFVGRDGRLVGERIQGPVSEDVLAKNIELALGT